MKNVIDKTAKLKIPVLSFDILWTDYDRSVTVPNDAKEAANRFNTDNLDILMNYAAENNVFVILQLLVHAHWGLPLWWKEYKDNKRGYQLLDAVSDPSGEFNRMQSPVASFQSRTHRDLLKALITRVVRRYRAHPALAGWQINLGPTGENGYGPSYIETRFNKKLPRIDFRSAMTDYSPVAKDNFRLWLKSKYVDISALNASWLTEYSSFTRVDPPLPIKSSPFETFVKNGDGRSSMIDWQQFRYDALMDEWIFLTEMVRKLDPDKIILGKTSWHPAGKKTGTEAMMATAAGVNKARLIDADKVDTGILAKDYVSGKMFPAYRIDYANYVEFSRRYNIARIINLENWVKTEDPATRGAPIPPERAVAVRNSIRDGGGYLWFVVSLPHDQHGKPDWAWSEVEQLVDNSNLNELENIIIDEPLLLFYYDIQNLMSHYYEEKGNLRACRIYYQIAKALFDSNKGQLKSGFISAVDFADSQLNPLGKSKILVMANQRVVSTEILTHLKCFISSGGLLLLVGSNGVFDKAFAEKPFGVKRLGGLNNAQVQNLYRWGREVNVKVPFIAIKSSGTSYIEIPIDGGPVNNYRMLRKALGNSMSIPQDGNFSLRGKKNKGPVRQPMNNFTQGRCGDGICDAHEQRTAVCKTDCPHH